MFSPRKLLTVTVALIGLSAPLHLSTPAATAGPSGAVAAAASTTPTEKEKVRSWYRNRYLPAMSTDIGWTGNTLLCNPGRFSSTALTAMQRQLDVIRDLARLDRVKLTTSTAQQQAALMMEANNSLDHSPPSSWRCYTRAGAAGAGTSNLAISYGDAGEPLDLYMADPGDGNKAVGHRRWILYPQARSFVVGQTGEANALKVIGTARSDSATRPRFTEWPRRGWSPTQLEPGGRWSLTVNTEGAKWVRPSVTVYRNGVKLPTPRVYAPAYGYGNPTLVWRMPNEGRARVGNYKVVVKGLKYANGQTTTVMYHAKLFMA